MKKTNRLRFMSNYMSVYLYSVNSPPFELNKLYLQWLNHGVVPKYKEIRKAIKKADKTNKPA